MKPLLAVALVAMTSAALAGDYRPLETTEQARQRHSAENYQRYKERGRDAPLGGYQDKLGDPAPYGSERPGYRSEPSYRPQTDGYRQPSDDWRRGIR